MHNIRTHKSQMITTWEITFLIVIALTIIFFIKVLAF